MIPNVLFIVPLLQFLELALTFLSDDIIEYDSDEDNFLILNFVNIIPIILELLINTFDMTKDFSRENDAYKLIRYCANFRLTYCHLDMWNILIRNWNHFYWLSGEIPPTFRLLMDEINPFLPVKNSGRYCVLNTENQVLLTLIWLRRYPTLDHLGMHFGIPVTCVHRIIHKMIPILHASTVHKYIQWHSNQEWLNLAGTIALWPNVVAILDGTPFRINRPQGKYQRIFYRRDRHCFFLNWIVIIDINGFIVLSRPGHITLPPFPAGLQIMADQGFQNQRPLLLPVGNNGNAIRGIIKEYFRSTRSSIERVFGILKSSYSSVGTRRFRHRRHIAPLVCNVTAALHNRRKKLMTVLRANLLS